MRIKGNNRDHPLTVHEKYLIQRKVAMIPPILLIDRNH